MIVIKDEGRNRSANISAVFLFIWESRMFLIFVMKLQGTIKIYETPLLAKLRFMFPGHFEVNEHHLMSKGDFPARNNGYGDV